MNKPDFKMCWISYNRIYLKDSDLNIYTINTIDLKEILQNTSLKITKQKINFKLEAFKNE